uniref:type VI secretion system protein IglI family protein n=1 Tax=Facilibium subflavum TaxID=2219058 RepID=UPI002286FB6E
MLYQDHSNFISFWKQAINDFDTQAELTPLLINSFMRTYESGEFDECQQKITAWVSAQKRYNAYLLLLSTACALLSSDVENNLLTQLKDIVTILHILDEGNKKNNVNEENAKTTLNLGSSLTGICRLIIGNLSMQLKELSALPDVESLNMAIKDTQQLARILTEWSLNNMLHDKGYISIIEQLKSLQYKAKKTQTDELSINQGDPSYKKQDEALSKEEKLKDTSDNYREAMPVQSTKNTNAKADGMLHKFASVHWYQLIKKIHLLKQLVNNERFFESAIIYQDIEQELISFDPKVYFPGLFFDLFKQISPKISEIYRFTALHQQSLQWHMAERLYQTDMERFVQELDSFIANEQSDEDFIEYQSFNMNTSEKTNIRLVDPQYAI